MTRLIYDGTFDGLLTAIFEIYERKLKLVNLQKGESFNGALFEDVIQVVTNDEQARRVLKGLTRKLSQGSIRRLYIAHLGDIENEDNTIVNYIRYAFDSEINIESDFGNKNVLRIAEIVTMMRRERHRMEAFIRFQKLEDGLFYAVIDPDFNVLPLLNDHFKKRYADQKWMIYDTRRNYGLYYDLNDTEFISMDFSEIISPAKVKAAFEADEEIYQHLWKNYFTSVNIVSRKNTKLHLRHIPKRYWKYLTEKI